MQSSTGPLPHTAPAALASWPVQLRLRWPLQELDTNVYGEPAQQNMTHVTQNLVIANKESTSVQSTHRCCAERRLLHSWILEARKRGLRNHQIVTWVRRKVGPDITVWRYQKDGLLACATPCWLCVRELQRFDMRVHCSQGGQAQAWFSGRLQAPQARPTAGQIKTIIRPQRVNQARQQRVTTKISAPVDVPDWLMARSGAERRLPPPFVN